MLKISLRANIIVVLVIVAIIILSTFTTIVYYQVEELNTAANEKEELPLLVSVSTDKSTGVVPLEVSFTPIISNSVGNINYKWDFGDGNTSDEIKPSYVYKKEGIFLCNLTVTDETNRKTTGSVKLNPFENSPPTVSIEANDRPRRPMNLLLEFIFESKLLEQIVHIDNYGANDYRWARDKGLLDFLFDDNDSFMPVEAIASDPDGDEIVSYNWTLKPAGYTTRIGKNPVEPKYHYSGKKIDIPTKDIYPVGDYSLICTVTDSAGKIRSEKFDFKVLKSYQKQTREEKVKTRDAKINKWVSNWRNNKIFGELGRFVFSLLVINILTKVVPLPLVKLATIILIDFVLQTPPEDYTDYENLMDPLKELTEKREYANKFTDTLTSKLKTDYPDLAKSFANFFGAEDIEELREYLGFDNKKPVIKDPFPEPSSNNIPISCPYTYITVEDPEGDSFNVTISGEYLNNVTYTNQNNGTFQATLITPLPEVTEIKWFVEVTDTLGRTINEEYTFKTFIPF